MRTSRSRPLCSCPCSASVRDTGTGTADWGTGNVRRGLGNGERAPWRVAPSRPAPGARVAHARPVRVPAGQAAGRSVRDPRGMAQGAGAAPFPGARSPIPVPRIPHRASRSSPRMGTSEGSKPPFPLGLPRRPLAPTTEPERRALRRPCSAHLTSTRTARSGRPGTGSGTGCNRSDNRARSSTAPWSRSCCWRYW